MTLSSLTAAGHAARTMTDDPEAPSVLGKARRLLEAFLADDLGVTAVLSLTELTRRSGVPKATVHRLCAELVEWGLLERTGPGGGYRLGLLLFEMGQRVSRQRLVRDAALRPMEALVARTGATVHLAIADGHDVLYVEKLPGPRPVDVASRVAGRLPLHATATGKVLLAFGGPALEREVLAAGLPRVTPRTVHSPALLHAQLARVRTERLADECEETILGYASTAAPVSDRTGVVAALSITARTHHDLRPYRADLRRAADAVSRVLSGD